MSAKALAQPQVGSSVAEHKWYALGLLMLVGLFNYVDRLCMSILQVPIKAELGLSDTQLGALTGLAFSLMYTTMTLPIARLADRTARKYVIAGALAVWSAMTVGCGFATGFLMLAILRMGVAIGEAGCVPATHALLSDFFPLHQRARALATWQLVFPLGTLIGLAASGWLNDAIGWRHTFMLLGVLGLCLAPVVLLTLKEPERGASDHAPVVGRSPSLREAVRILWSCRAYRYAMIGAALMSYPLNATLVWNAPFYSRAFGLSLQELAIYLALLSGGAGAIGLFGGGVVADRLGRRDARWYMWVPAIAGLGVAPLMLVQYSASNVQLSLIAGVLPVVLLNAFMPPQAAATQSLFPANLRATASATNVLSAGLFGAALGPFATGAISDWLVTGFGLERDSLRYAIGGSCLFAAAGGVMFLRAAAAMPRQLMRMQEPTSAQKPASVA